MWQYEAPLYQQTYNANIASWLAHFFEKAFVSRVRRRLCIRLLRFWRSMWVVLICDSSVRPQTGFLSMPAIAAWRVPALLFHLRRAVPLYQLSEIALISPSQQNRLMVRGEPVCRDLRPARTQT